MIATLVGSLVFLVYVGLFIFLCVKGKMKWASFLLLLLTFPMPILLGLIFIYALPASPETIIDGPVLPAIPIIVGFTLLLLSILTLRLSNKGEPIQNANSLWLGWIFVFIGVISQIIGLIIVLILIYTPSAMSSPGTGIVVFIVATSLSAIFLQIASSKGTTNHVNLFRWVSFFVVFLFMNHPFVLSCILLYAFPSKTPSIFPFWAGITMLGYLPYSVLLLSLARRYAPVTT